MASPRRGPSICRICFNFTRGFDLCYACAHCERMLDAVVPISYSVANEQLHRVLASYKHASGLGLRRLCLELAAVLWRYLITHEHCVCRASGVSGFELVTTVPSGDRLRDQDHPLRGLVSELVAPARRRHERLLRRSVVPVAPRTFDARKFTATRDMHGESVLLIDDTWTTGTSAQSAAAALKSAGASKVAAVVIGRHLNREWHENDRRLRGIERPFRWQRCALCSDPAPANGQGI